jgi:hypothetical protein
MSSAAKNACRSFTLVNNPCLLFSTLTAGRRWTWNNPRVGLYGAIRNRTSPAGAFYTEHSHTLTI